jgi:hypothetical protein
MALAMGPEVDMFSDVFGLYHKGQRSTLKLKNHIENYTGRDLTHQSDTLNALRAVFAFSLKDDRPVRQFWGIPVDIAGFDARSETPKQEIEDLDCFFQIGDNNLFNDFERLDNIDTVDLLSSRTKLYAILMYGLTWVQALTASVKRRNDFPSWSWAGWVTPISWPRYEGSTHIESTVRIDVIRRDGTCEVLTGDLIEKVFLNENNEASLYTYKLRMDIETIQVQFVDRGIEEGDRYVVLSSALPNDYWPLLLTPSIEHDPELYETLCSESFDCILCTQRYGIVVRERDGVAKRIGLLLLWGENDSSDEEYSGEDNSDEERSFEEDSDKEHSFEEDSDKEHLVDGDPNEDNSDEDNSDEESDGDDLDVDSDEDSSDDEESVGSNWYGPRQDIRDHFPVTRRTIILG